MLFVLKYFAMLILFAKIIKDAMYSRQTIADLWGYTSFHAIARGVVTPRDYNKIILFVTEQKQSSAAQYADRLSANILEWEGSNDHFAEERMIMAEVNGEEIHLFHRERHHSDFTYWWHIKVLSYTLHGDSPSHFKLAVL